LSHELASTTSSFATYSWFTASLICSAIMPQGGFTLDGQVFAAFHNVVACVYKWTAVILSNEVLPPSDVIQEVVTQWLIRTTSGTFERRGKALVWMTCSKRRGSQSCMTRKHALECVMSDWFDPLPRFDDVSLSQHVDWRREWLNIFFQTSCSWSILDFDPWLLWRDVNHSHCQISHCKTLIWYGVSFSGFQDYFYIGESIAWGCLWSLL
jgi:hypothetical protein